MADPGRPLNVKGDLDQVIADGLGIDLNAVKKTSSQLGIVQALAQASVPVANPDGSKVLDAHGLSALRGALATTLTRVANIAAPKAVTPPTVLTHGLASQRARDLEVAPDPLDQLIGRATSAGEEER